MKRKLKITLEKYLSRFLPYQIAMGGYQYYKANQENAYKPEEFLYYGKNVRIEKGVAIAAPERLYVGDNSGISQRCYINAVGGCHLGRCCQMAQETLILTTEHRYSGGKTLPYDTLRLIKPVYIEDYVWIGSRASILPGVRIGEGAIVGMGSVVAQDVPPLAIVMGNPAQVLTYRSREEFDRLKKEGQEVDPYKELPMLRVPPLTKRKYKLELKDLGFDLSGGHEYFQYDKYQKAGKKMIPVDFKE